MEAVSRVHKLFGTLVLAVDAAPYFRWGDAGQHEEVGSSGWTDASCYETACLLQTQSGLDELAMRGTDTVWTAILCRGHERSLRLKLILPPVKGVSCNTYYTKVSSDSCSATDDIFVLKQTYEKNTDRYVFRQSLL